MSYIKVKKIKKEQVETPEEGYVYFGYDDSTVGATSQGFWVKDDNGDVQYIISSYFTAPAITSFSPTTQCYNNDTLTINGANFIPDTTTVTFNGIAASVVNVVSPNQLTTIVPTNNHVIGEVDIVVTTQQYGSSQPVKYIILYRSLKPIISNSPSSASIGDTITITGSNFQIGTTVAFFNNFSGFTTVIDPYNITTIVPNISIGSVQLYVQDEVYGQSNLKDINITASTKPTFTSFYPTSGYAGDIIHISGTNFTTAQIQVSFGSKAASQITVVNSTYMTAKIADKTPLGSTRIRVYNSYLGGFTVLGSPALLTPRIVTIKPTTPALIGSVVTIGGFNLSGNLTVTFSGVECSAVPVDGSSCLVTINSSVVPGMNSVVVLNEFGKSNIYNYEVVHPVSGPTITSFVPTSAYIDDTISVYGTNFSTANAVYIGGIIAVVSYVSSTELLVRIPSGAPMAVVDIKVVNSSGSYVKGGFTVVKPINVPVINSISPIFGKFFDTIDIYGTYLSGCTLSFGSSYNSAITGITTSVDSTHLKVRVPDGIVSGGEDKVVNIYAKNVYGNCEYSPFDVFSTSDLLPSLYSFSPTYGITGTTISITGAGFTKFWTDSYISIVTGGTTTYLLMNSQLYQNTNTVTGVIPYVYGYTGNSSIKVVTPNGEAQKYPFLLSLTTTTTTTLQPTTTTTTTREVFSFYKATSTFYTTGSEACSQKSSTPYATLWTTSSVISSGTILYTNSALTSPYVGNSAYIVIRKSDGYDYVAVQVYPSGYISNVFSCSITTTTTSTILPTTTTTTTLAPTTTTTTTLAPTTTTTTTEHILPLYVEISPIVNTDYIEVNISGGKKPYYYDMSYSTYPIDCGSMTFTPDHDSTNNDNFSIKYSYSDFSTNYTVNIEVYDFSNSTFTATDSFSFLACLVPETLITMLDNVKKEIRNLTVGEKVLYLDDNLNLMETVVTSVTYHHTNTIVNINNGLLRSSESHNHMIRINNDIIKIAASKLKIGDILVNYEGVDVVINSIVLEYGKQDIVNISTESERYIANDILTHNKQRCLELSYDK